MNLRTTLHVVSYTTLGILLSSIPASSEGLDFGKPWPDGSEPPPGTVVEDATGWIRDFSYVEAVVYDFSAAPDRFLHHEGKLHPGLAPAWTRKLTEQQVTSLLKCLTGEHKGSLGGFCYEPHHGFIFRKKDGTIAGHFEVCLLCRGSFRDPQEGLSTYPDYLGIDALLEELNLPRFATWEEWKEFFADEKQVASGKLPTE